LTKKETILLSALCENIGKVLSKEDLVKLIWKGEDDPQCKEASLHNHVYRLRRYLEKDPTIALENFPGSGYMLSVTDNG